MAENLLYTDTDQVRAALGVTEREIADKQISDLNVGNQLEFSLESVYPDHAILQAAAEGASPTDAQKRLFKAMQLYCQYEGAYILTAQLQMLVAQKITDGDAEMQRFEKDNLDDTISRILSARNRYQAILVAGNPSAVTAATLVHFSTAQPAYDPVTNTGTNPSPGST